MLTIFRLFILLDVLSTEMIFENYLLRLRNIPLEDSDEDFAPNRSATTLEKEDETSPCLNVSSKYLHMIQSKDQ